MCRNVGDTPSQGHPPQPRPNLIIMNCHLFAINVKTPTAFGRERERTQLGDIPISCSPRTPPHNSRAGPIRFPTISSPNNTHACFHRVQAKSLIWAGGVVPSLTESCEISSPRNPCLLGKIPSAMKTLHKTTESAKYLGDVSFLLAFPLLNLALVGKWSFFRSPERTEPQNPAADVGGENGSVSCFPNKWTFTTRQSSVSDHQTEDGGLSRPGCPSSFTSRLRKAEKLQRGSKQHSVTCEK